MIVNSADIEKAILARKPGEDLVIKGFAHYQDPMLDFHFRKLRYMATEDQGELPSAFRIVDN